MKRYNTISINNNNYCNITFKGENKYEEDIIIILLY